MSNAKIHLLTGIYIQEEPRTTEIVGCLETNIENSLFPDVHIFIEDSKKDFEAKLATDAYPALGKLRELLKHPKVTIVPRYERPTYTQLFEYANSLFKAGDLVMITNSDIEYDGTLNILKDITMRNRFICLSREGGRGSYRAEVSQDTWIWESPIKPMKSGWTLGIAGGDNKIAYEAQEVGYEVVNPCLSIYTYHRHASGIHHWTPANRIAPPYLSVYPSRIEVDGGHGKFIVEELPPNKTKPAPRPPTPVPKELSPGFIRRSVSVQDGDLDTTFSIMKKDAENDKTKGVVIEFKEPLAEAMGTLAWPFWPDKEDPFKPRGPEPTQARRRIADWMCDFKVTVDGIRKKPANPEATVSLLVGTYMDFRPRAIELIECLEQNIQNPHIGDIHLFVEDPVIQWRNWLELGAWESNEKLTQRYAPTMRHMEKFPQLEVLKTLTYHPKVKLVPFGRRPFFSEYFDYANKNLPAGRRVILANSDMSFDEAVGMLPEYDLEGVFGCLARNSGRIFEEPPAGPASTSADAWIFQTPLRDVSMCSFPLGVRAGEYHLAWLLSDEAKYLLFNPCLSIHAKHHHKSDLRRWPKFPGITQRIYQIPGVSLEALRSDRFQEVKRKAQS